ncbi:MAG: hypothetical protein ABI885_08120 [Gammaproteobacteria bacterium]
MTNAIDAAIKATQFAQQRANEVAAAKAEADKAIEEARGVAESTLLKAKAEAQAIRVKGDALRENPRLVELSAIEKWKRHPAAVRRHRHDAVHIGATGEVMMPIVQQVAAQLPWGHIMHLLDAVKCPIGRGGLRYALRRARRQSGRRAGP